MTPLGPLRTFRLDDETWERVRQAAREDSAQLEYPISAAEWVRMAIDEKLAARKKKARNRG